ncbi:DUF2868 domain-containing protein [Janthinobacterium agaricidamnosum]|uniref:DUF2868 domain-containing protein n=1 Tax=Janthinobacterium agaricidamnosum NBRC 102515 = DSM 9628 TaxID=1349767 RepID=W0V069_9BURK|nr:DUF2868 domain-containing protein [Janthinobacterium agaricidamnosum]CDG80672.1 hypothetical protein GJA_3 [Janthinobacterium agaricidamnosum NBRC 102515 = DSM 9628]
MNEHIARDVVLVRAIETADQKREVLSDDDRMYASRSAKELAHWQASGKQSEVTTDDFLQQRSEQIIKRLVERIPAFATFAKRRNGLNTLTMTLPLLALLLGFGLDRITDPHRVDLLSAPLLLIIAWNVLVYLGLLAWLCIPSRQMNAAKAGWVRRLSVGKAALPRKLPHALSAGLLAFMAEWAQLSARLNGARLSRMIHVSAALFAIGAMLSLYARGVLSQYAAGWESTFLDASQVHDLLSVLFAPALSLFHLQGFSLAEVEALRFGSGAVSPEGGARWVHLYAATLLLLVVVPRIVLALISNWQAQRLATTFPLDLEQPYFRKFNETMGTVTGGVLRVLPYSFSVDEARDKGLAAIAVTLFGEQARLMLRPSTAYGEEPQEVLADTRLNDSEVNLTAVLFNLTATPEKENHGAFLDYLVRQSARGIAVLIDVSNFLERVGSQPDAKARLAERVALWQQFCHFHRAPATIVDLIDPSTHPLDAGAGLTLSTAP